MVFAPFNLFTLQMLSQMRWSVFFDLTSLSISNKLHLWWRLTLKCMLTLHLTVTKGRRSTVQMMKLSDWQQISVPPKQLVLCSWFDHRYVFTPLLHTLYLLLKNNVKVSEKKEGQMLSPVYCAAIKTIKILFLSFPGINSWAKKQPKKWIALNF